MSLSHFGILSACINWITSASDNRSIITVICMLVVAIPNVLTAFINWITGDKQWFLHMASAQNVK